jgi:hypothetical protein
MVQYHFNNRFSQHFTIWGEGKDFQIASCFSQLLLTASKLCREGDEILQKAKDKSKEQDWVFEYLGRNLYVIKSAANPELMMGVKEKCCKEGTSVICTKN